MVLKHRGSSFTVPYYALKKVFQIKLMAKEGTLILMNNVEYKDYTQSQDTHLFPCDYTDMVLCPFV